MNLTQLERVKSELKRRNGGDLTIDGKLVNKSSSTLRQPPWSSPVGEEAGPARPRGLQVAPAQVATGRGRRPKNTKKVPAMEELVGKLIEKGK